MYIHVKVQAEARKELVKKIDATHYAVQVKEPALNNCANRRMLEIMKIELGTQRLRLVSGHHSPSKIIDRLDEPAN